MGGRLSLGREMMTMSSSPSSPSSSSSPSCCSEANEAVAASGMTGSRFTDDFVDFRFIILKIIN